VGAVLSKVLSGPALSLRDNAMLDSWPHVHQSAIPADARSEFVCCVCCCCAAVGGVFLRVCLQRSASGRETEQNGQADQVRVPRKDDVLEFEMAEPTAPGGVEWLAGTVVKVDGKKKKFTVVIKNDEDDESTWNQETYSVRQGRWSSSLP
jgi:hypothetical protein